MPPPTAPAVPIRVATVKIEASIPASALAGLVPPEPAPAGSPVLTLILDGAGPSWTVQATLSGKSVRRVNKTVAEHGPDAVKVILSGTLHPPTTPGKPFRLENAGVTAIIKTPKPVAAATETGEPRP